MGEQLKKINQTYSSQISDSNTLSQLDEIFIKLFGKSGEITQFSKNFSKTPKEVLKELVPLFNRSKVELERQINDKRLKIKEEFYEKLKNENLDLSRGEVKRRGGKLHLLTQLEDEIAKIFGKLGFQQYDAPHIDSDYINFEVLNIPEEHPARDLWDTLYIEQGLDSIASLQNDNKVSPGKLLLRTHTSNSQYRIMKDFKPPFRMMNIGRCFRRENLDARHEHTFEQFELIYVDKGLSMANLLYLSELYFKAIFGKDIKARLKPKYYPFVEPGAGVDGLCIFCKGKGCSICGGIGWLELAGAGMIHPEVLRKGGIDPEEYTGIAWGMGPGRIAMLKYGVTDIRDFNSGLIRSRKHEVGSTK